MNNKENRYLNEVYPNKGESKKDFIARFMEVTKDEYPDVKQRFAVANSYWSRRNKVNEEEHKMISEFLEELNKIDEYDEKKLRVKVYYSTLGGSAIAEEEYDYNEFMKNKDEIYKELSSLDEHPLIGAQVFDEDGYYVRTIEDDEWLGESMNEDMINEDKNVKYTIRSTSDEGVYYLVNGWNKHKTFWVKEENLTEDKLFNTPEQAKASLTKLIKVMDDYGDDKFELVSVEDDKITVIDGNLKDYKTFADTRRRDMIRRFMGKPVESLSEDTTKTKSGKWTNKGKEGTHGTFKTKKEADAQRKAMFAKGYQADGMKESLTKSKYYIIDNSIGAEDSYEEFDDREEFMDSLSYNYDTAIEFGDILDDFDDIRNAFDSKRDHSEEVNGFVYAKLTDTSIDAFLGNEDEDDTDESLKESIENAEGAYSYVITDEDDNILEDFIDEQQAIEFAENNKEAKFVEKVFVEDEDYDWDSAEVIWTRGEIDESADEREPYEAVSKETGEVFHIKPIRKGEKLAVLVSESDEKIKVPLYDLYDLYDVYDLEGNKLGGELDESKKLNESHSIVDKLNAFRKKYPKAVWFDNGKEVIIRETRENERRLKEFDLLDYSMYDEYNNYDVYVIDYSTEYDTLSAKNEALKEDFTKKEGKEIIDWWKEVEIWNGENDHPFNIDNGDYSDIEELHSAMFDMLNNLKDKNPELYKKGKRIYNKKAMSKISEDVDDIDLPSKLTIDIETMNDLGIDSTEMDEDEIADIVGDYLSDEYGFTHYGFEVDIKDDHIDVYDIEWDIDESLTESNKLNEGAGAGYHVNGKLTDITLKNITSREVTEEKYDYGEYGKNVLYRFGVEGTAHFEGMAESYYDGAEVEGDVEITYITLANGVSREEPDKSIDDFTIEDLIWEVGSSVKFKSKTIGAGWLHSKFDGEVVANPDEVWELGFKFTDFETIAFIDSAVQGNNKFADYDIYDDDDEFVDTYDDEDVAIDTAKRNGYARVERREYFYDQDEEPMWETETYETIWRKEEESLKEDYSVKYITDDIFEKTTSKLLKDEIDRDKVSVVVKDGKTWWTERNSLSARAGKILDREMKRLYPELISLSKISVKEDTAFIANEDQFKEINRICKKIGIETVSDLKHFKKEMGCENCSTEKLIELLREYEKELGDDFKIEESLDEIKISELTADTYSVKDDSVRGFKTKSKEQVKVGDEIIIDNHFTKVVEDDKVEECKGSINIRESLNDIDNSNYNQFDLRNLYDSQILSESRKVELAKLLHENKDAKEIYKFLAEGLNEEEEEETVEETEEKEEEERGNAFFIRKPTSLEDIKKVKEERIVIDPDSIGDDYSVIKVVESENIQSLGALNSIAEKYATLFDEIGDNYYDHYVIKVRTPEGDWLIDTNGYDYARYVAFVEKE